MKVSELIFKHLLFFPEEEVMFPAYNGKAVSYGAVDACVHVTKDRLLPEVMHTPGPIDDRLLEETPDSVSLLVSLYPLSHAVQKD